HANNAKAGDHCCATTPGIPFLSTIEKWQRKQQGNKRSRNYGSAYPFERAGEITKKLKQKKEIPFRSRKHGRVGGISWACRRRISKYGEQQNTAQDKGDRDCVFQDLIWVEIRRSGRFSFTRLPG